jgi:hypothetical protein
LKLLAFGLTAAALALAQPSPPPAKNPVKNIGRGTALPDAKTILSRAAAATGGIDAQKSIKTQKLVGTMGVPEAGISGTIITYRSQRGEMYQIIEMPGAGKIEAGNNGDVEWERSTLTGPKIRRVASTPGNLLQPDPTALAVADNYSKIETAGLDMVNGKPCFIVHIWPENSGSMQTACYDRQTFLPVHLEINAGTVKLDLILGDYRTVGAVKLPFLTETQAMGQTIRLQWETITLNDPLPPEAIELPEEIEILAYRPRTEIRDVEVDDKDRPTLRRRTTPQTKK